MRVRLSVVVVLTLGVLAWGGSAQAAGSKTFTDPAGDGSNGPDITQLVVSNDDNGQLTFAFTFSNRPTILTGDDIVVLGIDADRNGSSGNSLGYEYAFGFGFEGQQVALGKWNGSTFDINVPHATLRVTDGGRTISVNRSELGNTAAFDFRVVTQGGGPGDTAPEGGISQIWTYELQIQVARPTVQRVRVQFTPAQPRAGKVFAFVGVTLGLSDGTEVPPTSYSCRGTLAGKVLRASSRCRWTIPKNAKGKRFAVVVTVSYGGETGQSGAFSFRVRA